MKEKAQGERRKRSGEYIRHQVAILSDKGRDGVLRKIDGWRDIWASVSERSGRVPWYTLSTSCWVYIHNFTHLKLWSPENETTAGVNLWRDASRPGWNLERFSAEISVRCTSSLNLIDFNSVSPFPEIYRLKHPAGPATVFGCHIPPPSSALGSWNWYRSSSVPCVQSLKRFLSSRRRRF